MFQFVRRVVAALLNRLWPFNPPADPYAAVREPRRRNPGDRSSAIALAEPEPEKRVQAVGTSGTHRNDADSYEGAGASRHGSAPCGRDRVRQPLEKR